MAQSNKKPPAKKTFCVWADYVRRVSQHIEAASPKAAYNAAKRKHECWQPCDWHDNNGYRLSNEVQDLSTEEFIPIHGDKNCRTCGSEIAETINESNFPDGECGPCEHERYASKVTAANLLETLSAIRNDCASWFDGNFDMNAADLFAAFISAADKAIARAKFRRK